MQARTARIARFILGAALIISGAMSCVSADLMGPTFCLESCGGGVGYQGPFIFEAILVPYANVDSTSESTRAFSLHVGDSVTVYAVKYDGNNSPCVSPDTLRSVKWSSFDSTVARAGTRSNGRGVVTAVRAGKTALIAADTLSYTGSNLWSCTGARDVYLSSLKVTP